MSHNDVRRERFFLRLAEWALSRDPEAVVVYGSVTMAALAAFLAVLL